MTRITLFCLSLIFLCSALQAQIPVGQWRVHLPYAFATAVESTDEAVYCGTRQAMFVYDREDQSLRSLSRIDGMTDQGITALRYSEEYKTLIITYESGNIDLMRKGRFTMIDAIVRANIPGLKRINHIHLRGRFAYLSCAFGIVELDLERSEIRNTFIIGPNASNLQVYALDDDGQNFYAATDSGLFIAALNAPNLSNFSFWQPESRFRGTRLRHVAVFNNDVFTITGDQLHRYRQGTWLDTVLNEGFVNTGMTVRKNNFIVTNIFRAMNIRPDLSFSGTFGDERVREAVMAVYDGRDIWMADNGGGLFRFVEGFANQLLPNGPATASAIQMDASAAGVMVAAGGITSVFSNLFNSDGAFVFENERWGAYNRFNLSGVQDMFDIMQVRFDPNRQDMRYLLSWGKGLVALRNGDVQQVYDPTNSSLEYIAGSVDPNTGIGQTRVGGLDFDNQGQLWVSNYGAGLPISVRRADGSWQSYSLGLNNEVVDMLVDNSGNKWVRNRRGGIMVLNRENNQFVSVVAVEGQGGLPSPQVNCMAKDKNGAIWIGTTEGPAVFFNPNAVFRDRFDAQQIRIQQEQFVGFLLGNEVITAIAIDGADRKWFGTANGLWLFSADGTQQIHHFTRENSPLLSNIITSLAIHPETGEVFIGTDRGIISYRGTATEGRLTHTDVKVFPNPVRPEYDGLVSVSGLVTNAWIKITDISGNLVFQTRADGGQISWNGRDVNGRKVNSGVYLVLATSDFGEETVAAKILFLK
jgi:hypothetical protein